MSSCMRCGRRWEYIFRARNTTLHISHEDEPGSLEDGRAQKDKKKEPRQQRGSSLAYNEPLRTPPAPAPATGQDDGGARSAERQLTSGGGNDGRRDDAGSDRGEPVVAVTL